MTNCPDLPLNNNKKSISPGALNHGEKEIRPVGNDNENIKPMDINQQRPTTLNWTSRNRLWSELSRNFREVTFSESELLVNTSVLDTRYEHPRI